MGDMSEWSRYMCDSCRIGWSAGEGDPAPGGSCARLDELPAGKASVPYEGLTVEVRGGGQPNRANAGQIAQVDELMKRAIHGDDSAVASLQKMVDVGANPIPAMVKKELLKLRKAMSDGKCQ